MKPSKQVLKEFASTHSWETQMNRAQGLDSWNNYSGPSMGTWVVSVGRNRDSEILELSNFDVALERLGGESKHVRIERFGHWGCGWFELILVNPRNAKALKEAYSIHRDLKSYSVLDESDFSEREYEAYQEYADGAKADLAKALALHFGLKNTRTLRSLAYELNMEAQFYGGNDCCVNIYSGRKPDQRDLRELQRHLNSVYDNSDRYPKLIKQLTTKLTTLINKE